MPTLSGPALLENPIKQYAWGSRRALAELQGRPVPSPTPEAELWLGAHPAGPSRVVVETGRHSLPDVIAGDPEGVLGADVEARFGRLPFLLKVLAAEQPLSIQAHPSQAQARAGFDAEERASVPLDAPHRNYKDPFHKPELICAVEPFEALCGFRDVAEVTRLAERLGSGGLQRLVARAAGAESPLQQLFVGALRMPAEERTELVREVVARCREVSSTANAGEASVARWVVELDARYPADAGVLAPLFLNYVALEAGEALYLGAGSPHAYLRGVGIEIMASSDNVLRGGLTPKHVDVAELERVLRFEPETVTKLRAEAAPSGESVYLTPAPEFRLSRIELDSGQVFTSRQRKPEILLCWQGSAGLRAGGHELALARGTSLFVPALSGGYSLSGRAVVFRAAVNDARAP